MWGWTAALALCGVLITRLGGYARIAVFLVAAGITAYGILKLRLLNPVLLHHYNPRKGRKREGSNGGDDSGGHEGTGE